MVKFFSQVVNWKLQIRQALKVPYHESFNLRFYKETQNEKLQEMTFKEKKTLFYCPKKKNNNNPLFFFISNGSVKKNTTKNRSLLGRIETTHLSTQTHIQQEPILHQVFK